jgi:AAA domain
MDAGDMYHDEEDIEEWRKSKKLNKNMTETIEKKAIVKGKEKESLVLPQKASKPEAVNLRTMIISGLPKSGKTTAVAKLPNSLIIDTENGTDFVECMKLKFPEGVGPVGKFKWLREVAAKIKEEGRPYDYVIVDTLSELDVLAEWEGTWKYMNSMQGKAFNRDGNGNHLKPSDPNYESVLTLGQGYGYRYTREAILGIFDTLKDLGKICTIFICHVADKMISKGASEEVMVKDLALVGKTRDILPRTVDATATVWNDEGKMMISFKGNERKIGGVRAKHLVGYEGELIWDKIFI